MGEMLAAGIRNAESAVFKPIQRMKAPAGRAPWIVFEQTGMASQLPEFEGKLGD
jgi:hypothetical protein